MITVDQGLRPRPVYRVLEMYRFHACVGRRNKVRPEDETRDRCRSGSGGGGEGERGGARVGRRRDAGQKSTGLSLDGGEGDDRYLVEGGEERGTHKRERWIEREIRDQEGVGVRASCVSS